MRQLAYISKMSKTCGPADVTHILHQSRLNNKQYFVTGLLLTDGHQFLQVLEGGAQEVSTIFQRIGKDPRHRDIKLLANRDVPGREFGDWAMAANDGAPESYGERVDRLVSGVSCPSLKANFNNFADYC